MRRKLKKYEKSYHNEIEFFLETLSDFVDRDFSLLPSLKVAKKSSKYYVSSKLFDRLIQIAMPEIRGLDEAHQQLKEKRKSVQNLVEEKNA